jgi:predicted Rossmann fold nucleotide-binding protein DprA/Smf involved in DNA uptake
VATAQLSADAQAIALVCSSLALAGERSVKQLTLREWQQLRAALADSSWRRPGELLGRDASELRDELGLSGELAERLALLLTRGGQLALELDRLAGRGIWVLTSADDLYPRRLRALLGAKAPPLLYGAGPHSALSVAALAVVGSRDANPDALAFARELGRHCARQRVAIVSGAARGIDLEAMAGAVEAGGIAVGVTVDPLERLVRRPDLRSAIGEELLTLVTPYHPAARWQASNAMRRNRFVYALSQAAVVAATAADSGGTWTGAVENLKYDWVPLYVRAGADAGSRELTHKGAQALPRGPLEEINVWSLLGDRAPAPALERQLPDRLAPSPARELPPADTAEQTAAKQSPAEAPKDVFSAVWPSLAAFLAEPRSEQDVATALGLQLVQARVWLKRAVEQNMVQLKKRPKKTYEIARDDSQLTLD